MGVLDFLKGGVVKDIGNILDDVITSGASLFTAANALHSAGASAVDGISLARSRRFQRNRILATIGRGNDSNLGKPR